MMKLFPEQLHAQLHAELRNVYLLLGNDPLLVQESQNHIREAGSNLGFAELHTFQVDAHTDWDPIYSLCKALSLFASRQILTLNLPENGPNAIISGQLTKLSTLLHDDILLIIIGPKLTRAQENTPWFTALSQHAVQINCQTPEKNQLPRWVKQRARQLKLALDDSACAFLCYCYEGNLLALAQALERLKLLWPDGKLTLPRVEQAVSDAAHFSPFHWIDALLAGKSKRALHILTQLALQAEEPVIVMRTLQRELMQLLTLQRNVTHQPLRALFDQHRIWQQRRPLYSECLQRLDARSLAQAIHTLARIELTLKQDFGRSIWQELEGLTLFICFPQVYIPFDNE